MEICCRGDLVLQCVSAFCQHLLVALKRAWFAPVHKIPRYACAAVRFRTGVSNPRFQASRSSAPYYTTQLQNLSFFTNRTASYPSIDLKAVLWAPMSAYRPLPASGPRRRAEKHMGVSMQPSLKAEVDLLCKRPFPLQPYSSMPLHYAGQLQ